jgi:pimeloyl-ACP methyl ester carboxylesterase
MIYSVTPGDDPPVVVVAALGLGRASWHPVIDRLAGKSSTLAYDRPGIGAAPAGADPAEPISYGLLAEELAEVLDQSGVAGPVVLAGHSMGSNVVRVFAGRYPARVAGLVFVDGSLPRLAMRPAELPLTDDADPQANPIDILAGEVEVRSAVVPPVPAIVLTRTPGWWSSYPIPHPALDQLWQINQRDLAAEHRAPLLVAEQSGHHMPAEAPALVAYGIDLVVRAVRTGNDPAPGETELAAVGGRLA